MLIGMHVRGVGILKASIVFKQQHMEPSHKVIEMYRVPRAASRIHMETHVCGHSDMRTSL